MRTGTLSQATKRDDEVSILVVDDEEQVGRALQAFLQKAFPKVRVLLETDPVRALTRLGDGVKIVIADQVMVGMTGTEFLAYARRRAGGVQRILVSGHVSSLLDRKGLAEADPAYVLLKPLATQPFVEVVEKLLKAKGHVAGQNGSA